MQNETGNHIGGCNDTVLLEAEVRSAVEQGHDVQEIVWQLTLRKIADGVLTGLADPSKPGHPQGKEN